MPTAQTALTSVKETVVSAGAKEDGEVVVDISYDIIRHVSAQLYTTPRKAIEELVCNSYDAGATECYVRLPHAKNDSLLVLDNGKSMDKGGLQGLWQVAQSPKAGDDPDEPRIDNNRLQIGKFGVGKLAAFALGGRLTHIASIGDMTRIVSVGQDEIREKGDGGAPTFKIYKLKEADARKILEPFLQGLPKPWEKGWKTWTAAVVEEVDENHFGRALRFELLRRMIETALPVSAKFKVHLDGQPITPAGINADEIELTIQITQADFRKKIELDLQYYWQGVREYENPDQVPKELYKINLVKMTHPEDVSKEVNAIEVPGLGAVAGRAILGTKTLTTEKLGERGYANHGFQVYAYGKLVNPEDELFGITPRSMGYWRRFQAKVEIPGLDRVLLVQRNAVSENSQEAQLAREVLRSLFNYTRSRAQALEEEATYVPPIFGAKMRKVSPLLTPLALQGLSEGKLPSNLIDKVEIDFATLGEDGPPATFSIDDRKIIVNEDHPIMSSLDELGEEQGKQMRRVISETVAGNVLAEGLLTAKGVDPELVAEARELMDASLRSAASHLRDPIEAHVQEIEEASHEGGPRFENAVANAFRSMRLAARRKGESGAADGIIEIPISGKPNLMVSVEAKGSDGVITHKQLSQATVDRHRKEAGCSCAIAVAREFLTEGKAGKSALIRENEDKVVLLTTEAIAMMLRLHGRRRFTYDKVAKILTTWKHPDEAIAFIEEVWAEKPADVGLMELVLNVAHDKSADHDVNYPDVGMIVDDPRVKKLKLKRDDVKKILEAVAITTGMVLIRDQATFEFEITAPVETILEAMAAPEEEPAAGPGSGGQGSKSKGPQKLDKK